MVNIRAKCSVRRLPDAHIASIDKKPFVSYKIQCLSIRETDEFSRWLVALRDHVAKAKILVSLLCGGDKDSQDQDIARAKKLARELER